MKRIYFVILLYILCVILIFALKPAMMFDLEGNFKHFGYDEKDTSASLLNIEVVMIFMAIFCYFIVTAFELAMA